MDKKKPNKARFIDPAPYIPFYMNRFAPSRIVGGDLTAPVLSSPTDTKTGSTTADLGVTTDEGNGTLYTVVTTSATQPTKPQIKSGLDHLGAAAAFADDQAIGSTGAKTFSATGLTASTSYFAHFMHEDAAGNQSNVSSGDGFTTDADSGEAGSPIGLLLLLTKAA